MSTPSTPDPRPSSRRRIESPPGESSLAIRPKESEALSGAGALVLGSGIPAFREDSLYIPTSAENELTYTTLEAWWEVMTTGIKDPKMIVFSIEHVL